MAHIIDADKLHSEMEQSYNQLMDQYAMQERMLPTNVPHYSDISEVRKYDSFGRLTDQPGDNVRRKAVTNDSGQVVGLQNAEHDNRAVVVGMIIGLVLFVGVIYWLAYVGQQYPGW